MSSYADFRRAAESLLDGANSTARILYSFTTATAAPTSTPDALTPTTDGFRCDNSAYVGLWVLPAIGQTIAYEVYRYNWVTERWTLCVARSGITEMDEVQIETGHFIHRIAVRCTALTGGTARVWGAKAG